MSRSEKRSVLQRGALGLWALALSCSAAPGGLVLQGEAVFSSADGGIPVAFPPIGGLTGTRFEALPQSATRGYTREDVHAAVPRQASLALVQPQGGTLDFLESVELYLQSGTRETLLASRTGVAAASKPGQPLMLDARTQTDVSVELLGERFSVVLRGKQTAPADATRVRVEVTLDVRTAP